MNISTRIEQYLRPLCHHIRIIVIDMAFPDASVISMGVVDGEAAHPLRHPVGEPGGVVGGVGVGSWVIVITTRLVY